MSKKPVLQTVFLWYEVVMAIGILFLTIPALVSAMNHGGLLSKPPAIIILSLLAVLYLISGVSGLRGRPTTKFLHLAGALATLIIALMMSSMGAPRCVAGPDLLSLGLSLYAVIVIYLFTFSFKEKSV